MGQNIPKLPTNSKRSVSSPPKKVDCEQKSNLPLSSAQQNDEESDSNNQNSSFINSAIIGYATDSAIIGGIIGGDLLGGIIGDMLND